MNSRHACGAPIAACAILIGGSAALGQTAQGESWPYGPWIEGTYGPRHDARNVTRPGGRGPDMYDFAYDYGLYDGYYDWDYPRVLVEPEQDLYDAYDRFYFERQGYEFDDVRPLDVRPRARRSTGGGVWAGADRVESYPDHVYGIWGDYSGAEDRTFYTADESFDSWYDEPSSTVRRRSTGWYAE